MPAKCLSNGIPKGEKGSTNGKKSEVETECDRLMKAIGELIVENDFKKKSCGNAFDRPEEHSKKEFERVEYAKAMRLVDAA